MRLLITGAISWDEKQKRELQEMGHELIYVQDERVPLTEQGISCSGVEGVICNGLFLYNDISLFQKLRYIQLTSAGYDRVPMDYVREHGIEIHNARGVYSIPMAEFAIGGVLQIYKQSRFFYENQKSHKWEKNRRVSEVYGKQVCIVGCGSVGTECAKRFKAFGCQVTGVDLNPRETENFEYMYSLEELDTVLPQGDIIVLTVPLADQTRHLVNEERLRTLKQGAILVNIARGAIVDTDALASILPELGGAVLDVFEEEPLAENSPLWGMENVIITPHNSFVGEGNRERLQNLILKNIEEIKNEKDRIY